MMTGVKTAFEQLTGQALPDEAVQRLYRMKNALRLGDNDALWLLLLALEYPITFYEKLPTQLQQASTEVLNEFRATADSIAKASAEAAQADFASAVATAAHKVADSVAVTKKLQWIVGAIVAVVVFGCVMLFLGYQAGGSDLVAVRASDAEWLDSHEGRQARKWGEWVTALVDAGMLSDRKPDRSSCDPRTVKGHQWMELWSDDGSSRFCSVWQGHVLIHLQWPPAH